MNSTMSIHLSADLGQQFHGCAATFAEEVFGQTLYAHAVPIAAAIRSFYRDILEFGVVERAVVADKSLSPIANTSASALPVLQSESDVHASVLMDALDDCPPPTHWGINE
jgi:hypothetical protein